MLNGELKLEEFRESINSKYGYYPSSETIKSCLRNINFEFIRDKETSSSKKMKH